MPSYSLTESKSRYKFQVELPGITKDNIDLNITESRIVIIEGSAAPSQLKNKDLRIHNCRELGGFSMRKVLNNPIDQKTVEANLKDGILYIILHKLDCKKSTRIPIKEV
jgi:HSP20 family protein